MTSNHRATLVAAVTLLLAGCGGSPNAGVELVDDGATSSSAAALSVNALTPAQSATVLRLVDNICGDTWCAGDYDFRFTRITCERCTSTCNLSFRVIPREGVPSARSSYARECRSHGYTGVDSLVATAPNGYQSLQPAYYDALTECISLVEERLH